VGLVIFRDSGRHTLIASTTQPPKSIEHGNERNNKAKNSENEDGGGYGSSMFSHPV